MVSSAVIVSVLAFGTAVCALTNSLIPLLDRLLKNE
jgi:hypothetical protein